MPNTIEENIERLKAVVPAIKNSIITKGGTVNSGDGLEEFADDVLSIKNELTDISITSNGEYYSGEETTLTTTAFPVTVLDAVGTPLKHVDVIGNANQSGTPTPDNPIIPQGTGERTGNLWNEEGFSARAITSTHEHTDTNTYGTTLSTTIGKETIITQSEYPTGTAGYQNGFFFIDVDFSKYEIGDKVTLSFDYICNEVHSIEGQILTTLYAGKNSNGVPVVLSSGKWSVSGRLTTVITIIADMHPYVEVRLCGNSITVKNIMLNTGSTALPYEPYGIKIPVSNGGENLFDVSQVSWKNAIKNDYGEDIESTLSHYTTNFTEVKAETTYCLAGDLGPSDYAHRIYFYDEDKDWISRSDSLAYNVYTFTTPANCKYIQIQVSKNVTGNDWMLVEGSTPLPYEPYHHTTTPTYLGEVETTRKIKKRVLTGQEEMFYSAEYALFRIVIDDFETFGLRITPFYMSHFIVVSDGRALPDVPNNAAYSGSLSDNHYIFIKTTNYTTADAFKAYLAQQYAAGTPVTMWYVLANEENVVVNEPLMRIGDYADQLSIDTNIPFTQNTKNIINIDTTLKPSSASFTYNKKGTYIGYNKINVNVSNTYTAEDEGKVVNNATLVSQTAMPTEITVNNTYDTTLYNSIVVNVPPAPTPSVKSGVVFYDYDGTIVQSYSANDFANLSELPANPTHEGLTAQGWNWSLADAKTYVANSGPLNIGQMYTTSDGKTRVYISLPDGRTSPILQLYLNANTELDIDWGDGSTHSTWTTTINDYKSERHNYPDKGKYVIAITVVSGSFTFQSSNNGFNTFFTDGKRSNSSSDSAYLNSIQKIEIGTGVTSIGDYAFMYCYSLSSVTIPDSVTSIGIKAFGICCALSSITIPNNVTSIGSNTFSSCFSLSSVTIGDSVITIGNSAFNSCYSLSSITIPDNVTSIGSNTFSSCSSLSSVTIGDSVITIGNSAFANCYSLSSVTIPDSVTTIEISAFNGCSSLSSVTIGDSVTTIGNSSFQSCYSLSSVTIPDNVTTIGSSAFASCYALSSVTIGDSVTSIGNAAFQYCYALSSVTIPDSVTSIGNTVFAHCESLYSITIPDSVTTIGNNIFQYCYSLSSVTIPDSVTTIGSAAFASCYSLSSVTIPDSVTKIQSDTFHYCYSLSSVTIPDSVTTIQSNAFSNCKNMDYIKFLGTTPPTVSSSNAWTLLSESTILYTPALVSNLYMDGTNYPAKATYTYIGYATYASGETLPSTTTDETYTLTWYATSADAIAQTNPITQGTGNEVYSRATPVV